MLKINVLTIGNGEQSLDFCVSPAELGIEDDIFSENIYVNVVVLKSVLQLDFHISLKTNLSVECDRCLKPISLECLNEFELIFKPAVHKREISVSEDEIEDFKFYNPDTKYLDITKDVRDYLLLSVPMRRIPPEVDGICTVCNKKIENILAQRKNTKDINPVWEKLKEFKTKK